MAAFWQKILLGGPWVAGVCVIDAPVVVGTTCGMQVSLSKWRPGTKFSGVLVLWIPCIIRVFNAQHNCLSVFRAEQLQGAGVSHMLV